jgi:hypothetical protein
MRERMATLDLDDDDIVGVAVPPIKTSVAPPIPRAKVIPPAPASSVKPVSRIPVPTTAKMGTPAQAFTPPPVPSFDEFAIEASWDIPEPAPESMAPVSAPIASMVVPKHAPPMVEMPPVSTPEPPVSMVRPVQETPRVSLLDPTDIIFDSMYGLTFARSTAEGAEMCAETLAKALHARTVVIHMHDLTTRELRAIAAYGDGDFDIIGSKELSDDDLVASAVICNQKAVTMKFDGELSRLAPQRLHAVGAPRSVVAAPALSWGRCLAIVEVIDADERFAGRVADAVAYVAEHFVQFLLAARAA